MNEGAGRWSALAAAAGTAAYALPLIVPWPILVLGASAAAGMALSQGTARRTAWAGLSAVILVGVIAGHLSLVLSAAILSAFALSMSGMPALGVAILAMNLTLVATLQERVADVLHWAGLEAAGPSLIAIAILLLARPRLAPLAASGAALTILAAWVGNQIMPSPEIAMGVAAIPACGLAALMVTSRPDGRIQMTLLVTAALLVGLIPWTLAPPRTWNGVYALLPETPDAFEAKFFRNYVEALGFAGIEAKQPARPEDVPVDSLLLLPWSTSPFTTDAGDPIVKRISELASARRWTVVVAGEHTNLGDAANRIQAMAGRPILRNDLTVPPSNTDESGPLHVSDIRPWPHEAVLNRGASVQVSSLTDRVLLAGDGWWAEPNNGEWLWVGDYVWQPGDRAGRLALAVSSDMDGARWIVVGDNSLLLNSQLFADPRPAVRLLELATLWPACLNDVLIAGLIGLVCFRAVSPQWRARSPIAGLTSLAAIAVLGSWVIDRESSAWRDTYIGQSGFDEGNFNVTLAENPAFVSGTRRLIRLKAPVFGSVPLPEGNSLIFMLVDGAAEVGGVKLSRCHRMGSLLTAEGPYLMDAQACRVEGPSRVLIGSPENAAAVAVSNKKGTAIILLDIAFLGQKAPDQNAKWLLKEIQQ